MALSIVSWRDEQDGRQEFDAEIGANRYYAWGVGAGVTKHDGVRLLASRALTSPLLGPLEPGERGRVVLRVPSDAFTEDHHHLQLLSFRDQELRGPAASDLVEVPWRWHAGRSETEDPMTTTPYAVSRARSTTWNGPLPVSRPLRRPVQLSQAQFLDALAGIISQVLPVVKQALPFVEQIGKAISAPPAQQTPPAAQAAAAPDLAQLLAQLLAQVQQVTPPAPTPQLAESTSRYSYASIAPLLAALPALAPLLQSVLTPQTVQSLISAADPTKMLQATFAGLLDAARIGQQATDQLHAHLRALNPGTGDDILIPLLASMSTTASYNEGRPQHRISRVVRLELPDLVPIELGGYPQVAFRYGEDVTLPLSIASPRPIPKARLHVCVKDGETHKRVAERTWTYDRLEPGRVSQPVVLPAAVMHRLEPGREYLIGLKLTWPGKNGLMGATTNQLVRVVGEATFDSLDSGGTPVRLDDVDRDRDWWHRVWAATIDDRSSRMTARLDYEFRLLPGATANRRSRTSTDLEAITERRSEGTMSAGLGVAVQELSQLADRLAGEAFDEATITALSDPAFVAAFDRRATCKVTVHGRRGDQQAVWVWPEMKLHTAFLMTPGEVSPETGQVLSFETRGVQVPVPALAHVLTTRSR